MLRQCPCGKELGCYQDKIKVDIDTIFCKNLKLIGNCKIGKTTKISHGLCDDCIKKIRAKRK